MMKKSINIGENKIEFQLIESENYWCWQGYLDIADIKTEFEIDCGFYKGKVNWKDIEEFLSFIIEPNRIEKLARIHNESITKIGQNFFSNSKEIENWKMIFKNSIQLFGISDKHTFSYGLVFDFYEKTEQGIEGDAYGLYFVKMENEQWIASERYQI